MRQSTYLRKALNALQDAGWIVIMIDDGGDENTKVNSIGQAVKHAKDVDDCFLILENRGDGSEGMKRGWIRVVWQGPDETYEIGEEIICDYTVNLDPTLETLLEQSESH